MSKRIKEISLILTFFNFNVISNGQTHPTHLGIKGGGGFSTLSGDSKNPVNADFKKRPATTFEIFIETKVSYWLTFKSAGLALSFQGANKDGLQAFSFSDKYAQYYQPGQEPNHLYADINRQKRLNYLFGTTVFKAHPNGKKAIHIQPYISAGFFTAFLLSAKDIVKGSSLVYKDKDQTQILSNNTEVFGETKDVRGDLHKFNFGLNAGAGFSVDVHKIRIYAEGEGNYGLININKKAEDGKNYLQSICGTIGLSYNIGQIFPFKYLRGN